MKAICDGFWHKTFGNDYVIDLVPDEVTNILIAMNGENKMKEGQFPQRFHNTKINVQEKIGLKDFHGYKLKLQEKSTDRIWVIDLKVRKIDKKALGMIFESRYR